MQEPRVRQSKALVRMVVIAAIILPTSEFMYLVTTFLFAFSGGQYRMVAVVNIAAVLVIAFAGSVGALAWRRRSPSSASRWTALATGIGCSVALVSEWLLSFGLGAS